MKRFILTMTSLGFGLGLMAQDSYSFVQKTEAYVEINNGTVVSPAMEWEDFLHTIKIPFAFSYYLVPVDSLYIYDFGVDFLPNSANFVTPIGEDLVARGVNVSPASWRLDGSGTSRILKVQWSNVAFFSTEVAYPSDFVNYQLWLFEGSNKIEFHYGASSVTPASMVNLDMHPSLFGFGNSKIVGVGGDPAAGKAYYHPDSSKALDEHPASGTVYVFTPGWPNSVASLKAEQVRCYPNPVGEQLTVVSDAEIKTITVYNASGQLIVSEPATGLEHKLNTSGLPSGIYVVHVETAAGVYVQKLVR